MNPDIENEKEIRVKEVGADKFSRKVNYVVVIRKPYNQYASILHWHKCRQLKSVNRFLSCWKNFAKEVIVYTDKLPSPKIFVKYDEWFSSESYRKSISEALDLDFSDKRLNVVMKIGVGRKYGSSFDDMKKQKEAQSMNVLHRWKQYKDNSQFKKVMQDEELRELSKKIFGDLPKELK
jgi:hypothetical protein